MSAVTAGQVTPLQGLKTCQELRPADEPYNMLWCWAKQYLRKNSTRMETVRRCGQSPCV